jgi:hypothetical protein
LTFLALCLLGLVLGPADSGSTVSLAPGAEVTILLPMAEGEFWSLAEPCPALERDRIAEVFRVGRHRWAVLRFRVAGSGKLRLLRAGNGRATRWFTLDIKMDG